MYSDVVLLGCVVHCEVYRVIACSDRLHILSKHVNQGCQTHSTDGLVSVAFLFIYFLIKIISDINSSIKYKGGAKTRRHSALRGKSLSHD